MIAATAFAWLVTYALHSTLLLGGAWVLARLCRRPDVRDALWKLATTGALASATLQVGLELRAAQGASAGWGGSSWLSSAPGAGEGGLGAGFWVLAWAIGAGLGLGLRERRRRAFWRTLTGRRPVADPELLLEFRALSARFRLPRPVRLSASRQLPVPAALGRAEICVPEPAFWQLSPSQRESILAHELAHLERGDPLWRAAAELLATLFFFQPLHRIAAAQLHTVAELRCDDRVVVQTGHRRSLAESLAFFADRLGSRPVGAVSRLGGGASPLMLRVQRVLDPRTRRTADALPLAVLLGGACVVVALAAFGPGLAAPPGAFDSREEVLRRGIAVGPDGRIESIAPDGFLFVATRGPSGERRLLIRSAPDGKPLLRYSVNGRAAHFDLSARRWAAARRYPLP